MLLLGPLDFLLLIEVFRWNAQRDNRKLAFKEKSECAYTFCASPSQGESRNYHKYEYDRGMVWYGTLRYGISGLRCTKLLFKEKSERT